MWNNYFNRPRRDIPPANYREVSSDDDDYDSPLVSPSRPLPSRAGSPVELAVPTLNDNVDEELESVRQVLRNVGNTHTFRGTRPDPRPEPEGDDHTHNSQSEEQVSIPAGHGGEEVVEGHVVGGGSNLKVGAGNQNHTMVNYDQQNEDDEPNAIQNARDCKLPFNKNDIKLWFSLIESKMQFAGLKKQWSKRQVLVQLIPPEFHTIFRQYLQLQENEAGVDSYYQLKSAIIKHFGPKKADNFDKAINRVMTGTPSQLGREIMHDICPKVKPLTGCCCADTVLGIWRRSLPSVVRNQIADMDFNAATYAAVFDRADSVWASNAASTSVVATLTKETGGSASAEVAAASSNRGGRRGGRGRNNRGGGSGSSGGGGNQASNTNSGSSSGKPNQGQGQGRRGPRHPDNPPQNSCGLHWKFGRGAWTCADRHNCPWRDIESPRPRDNRNIGAAEIVD